MTESPWGHPSSLVLSRRNCLVVLLVSNTYVRDVFRKWRLALQAMSMPKLELLVNGIAPHLRIKNLFPLHGLLAFLSQASEGLQFYSGFKMSREAN